MKFGKEIQASQIPGWSPNYLDYKFLKKIISSLAANRPASEAAALALGVRPADGAGLDANVAPTTPEGLGEPPVHMDSDQDSTRGADFQAHKAAFFFKLERELEKINAFYLRKEAELTMRLETLLSKRRAAAMRGLPDAVDDPTQNHVEWSAVEEGFRLLERDLGKIQQFIEINATGFRKILKKWDKRSKSTTKELYLARQVDVQPVFNRQLISELADTVALCLLDLTDLSTGLKFEGSSVADIFSRQLSAERTAHMGPYHDLQSDLQKAVGSHDQTLIEDLVHYSDLLAQEPNGGRTNVARILWKVIIEAPPDLADLILNSLTTPFDFDFVDDINGRTCLHEAAMFGALRLVDLCLEKGSHKDRVDLYGRSPLHYAAMKGHAHVCRRLLEVQLSANLLDADNCSPLVYATMKGSSECVSVLLKEAVEVGSTRSSGDLLPLSLASRCGHVDVVMLLLQNGAQSIPNSNGEYPIHQAAQEGHDDVCRVLLQYPGWDTADKYHEWTPLFHAARHGHSGCVQILLAAGCRVDHVDEFGHLAVHYAAWYGHHACTSGLLAAGSPSGSCRELDPYTGPPPVDVDMSEESDMDAIPSLSLPPPIMPHRTYGHNYLDNRFLIQITLGSGVFSGEAPDSPPAVRLHSRLNIANNQDHHLPMSTPLKLVMTAGPDSNYAPYTVALPQQNEKDVFVFQVPSIDALTLTFSIYPNFGTKTIGRAVALPAMFSIGDISRRHILPILDNRLHVIGEVAFFMNIVSPFEGVTLEVGGAVETYWKSMTLAVPTMDSAISQRVPVSSRTMDSTNTSPSILSTVPSTTVSSLQDNYLFVTVQVTRDLHPVIYSDWLLPQSEFNLGVGDVTLAQFEALAARIGRTAASADETVDWRHRLKGCMLSLTELMTILPAGYGICLEFAYSSKSIKNLQLPPHALDLNSCVDAVLRAIYHTSAALGGAYSRRRIVFTSFFPDACVAINWKQPNYPVFFASQCAKETPIALTPTTLAYSNVGDHRMRSLASAVDFAKKNNMLGLLLDAEELTKVPTLIDDIRDAGLVICIYGTGTPKAASQVDAFLEDGMIIYKEHGLYG
ncbi:hypothetical protein HWV62_36049 [Athelia sp. TMB]|nr:hypothetical protein HWV62_36049 [Athelia sp. TMB]